MNHLNHKANWDGITKDLQKFQELYFDRIPSNHTVEDNWNYIKEAINTTVSKNIPTNKKISHKQHVPWITRTIIRLTRRKHRAYNTHKRTKKDSDWARFTSLRKRVHRELRASYWDYVNNLLDPEIDKSNKKFWRFIKARKQDNTGISTLRENGRIITDSQEKAEVLNNQFTSVFTREDTASMPDLPPTQYRPMNPITVTSNGVLKALQRLNPSKAAGPDKIQSRILKTSAEEIAPVLASLYQQTLQQGDIPQDWRNANVIPIYKKGDRTQASNYRPVSLTSISCKIMEHIIASQVMDHLDSQNILHPNQHGFRANRSCETQLLMTVDDLSKTINNHQQVDMAILDFAKAFDKVPHQRLLAKLDHYGINSQVRKWTQSFLGNRKQQVIIEGHSSTSSDVLSGVPQGSVLGPILFLIYINDIAANINSTIRMFADDCLVYRTITNTEDHLSLQQDLNTLVKWSDSWQMKFNVAKCSIIHVTQNRSKISHNYTMNDEILQTATTHPYLGVELSSNMKWDSHINIVTRKAHQMLGFLSRNLRHCPSSIKERAYKALVRPKVEYCASVWDPPTKNLRDKVETVQRKAARFVSNKPVYKDPKASVTKMIHDLQWESLDTRRKQAGLTMMYKIINNSVAIPILYHPPKATIINTRHSHNIKLLPYQSSSIQYQHSFFPRLIPVWNSLPGTVAEAPDVDSFKSMLQGVPM